MCPWNEADTVFIYFTILDVLENHFQEYFFIHISEGLLLCDLDLSPHDNLFCQISPSDLWFLKPQWSLENKSFYVVADFPQRYYSKKFVRSFNANDIGLKDMQCQFCYIVFVKRNCRPCTDSRGEKSRLYISTENVAKNSWHFSPTSLKFKLLFFHQVF